MNEIKEIQIIANLMKLKHQINVVDKKVKVCINNWLCKKDSLDEMNLF